jgi:uncharacterized protein (DUF302 family)
VARFGLIFGIQANLFVNFNGIIDLASNYSVAETMDRLELVLRKKGITIFARIDQAKEAEAAGLTMRPTELVIFGDPRTGTPLMNKFPSIAIDLPLKVLAWESAEGKTWLSYNSPEYLMQRHHLDSLPFKGLHTLIGAAAK